MIVNKSIQAILKCLCTKMLGSQEKDKMIPSLDEFIYSQLVRGLEKGVSIRERSEGGAAGAVPAISVWYIQFFCLMTKLLR